MANASKDQNRVSGVMAGSNADSGVTPVDVWADPTTHRLLVNSSGASGGTSAVDKAAFTVGTTSFTPSGGVFQTTLDTITDGTAAAFAIDSKRNLFGVIRDAAGNARGANVSAGNALIVDASATTQPVSGTVSITANSAINVAQINGVAPLMGNGVTGTGSLRVTISSDNTAFSVNANAGTNLNTSALALEAGGNLATVAAPVVSQGTVLGTTKVGLVAGSVTTNAPTFTTGQINQLSLTTAGGLRVDLKDSAANTNKFLVTPDSVALPANQSVNVSQINGVTTLMGNGITGTGSQRVTIASDNTAFAVNATLSAETTKVIGTINIAAAQTVATVTTVSTVTNLAQMNGATLLMGNGVTGTGAQRVTISSDNSAVAGVGAAATGAAVPANAVYEGFLAQTALPSAATAGNIVGGLSDKFGRVINVLGTVRDLRKTQTTTISASTAETTIVTAGAAGIFNDIVAIVVANTSASTNTRLDFRDATAGTVIFSFMAPGNSPSGIAIPGSSIPQTSSANNWTVTCGTSTTDIRVFVLFEQNK